MMCPNEKEIRKIFSFLRSETGMGTLKEKLTIYIPVHISIDTLIYYQK